MSLTNSFLSGFGSTQFNKLINQQNKSIDIIKVGDVLYEKRENKYMYILIGHRIWMQEYYAGIQIDKDWLAGLVQGLHESNINSSLAPLIAKTMTDYLLPEDIEIKIFNNTTNEEVLKEDLEFDVYNKFNFNILKNKIGMLLSSLGEIALKINLESNEPTIEIFTNGKYKASFGNSGKLEAIDFYTIANETNERIKYNIESRWLDTNTGNIHIYYSQELYSKTDGKLIEQVDFEDENLIVNLGGSLGAEVLFNKPFNARFIDEDISESDFQAIRKKLAEIDYIQTQFLEEIRLGKGKTYIPVEMLDENGNYKIDETVHIKTIALQTADATFTGQITHQQFEIREKEYNNIIQNKTNEILSIVGLNSNSIMYREGGFDKTATEVIKEDDITYKTIKSKRSLIKKPLENIMSVFIKLLSKKDYKVILDLPPLQYDNMTTIASNVQKLSTSKSTTIEKRVKMINPTFTEEEIKEQTIKIKIEESIPMTQEETDYAGKNGLIDISTLTMDDPLKQLEKE